jgi:fructose PTS system EIIA component
VTTAAHFTSPELILPRLNRRQPSAVIGELCSTLHREGRISEPLPLFNEAVGREMSCHTLTEEGWALPHARLRGLKRLSFAVGRSDSPFEWFCGGPGLVRLVFLFAVPEEDGGDYLALISGLAKLSQNSALCEKLFSAPDSEGILDVLSQTKLPGSSRAPAIESRTQLTESRPPGLHVPPVQNRADLEIRAPSPQARH